MSAYCVLGLYESILGPHRRVTPHLWRNLRSPRVESCTASICVTPQISDKSGYREHYKLKPLVGRDLLLLVFLWICTKWMHRKGWKLANVPDSPASATHCESSLACRGFPRIRWGALAIGCVEKRRADSSAFHRLETRKQNPSRRQDWV